MANSPKYMDIVLWTRRQMAEGVFLPGDKFLSETALQERFGVSRQTVRRALDDLTQAGQVVRLQGSGTYISGVNLSSRQSLKTPPPGTSMTVGIVSLYLDNYIFPGIIRGVESVFTSSGHNILVVSTQNELMGETRALQRMLDARPAGLIVEPTKSGLPCVNLDLYQEIQRRGMPLVFTDSRYAEVSAPCVALDDQAVGYQATEYLIQMGHRNIVGIFSHSNSAGQLRYLGHMKALAAHGLPLRDDLIHWYNQEEMRQVLTGELFLNSLSGCSAALCYNDHLATILMELLTERGYNIPRDLSVVSIDNTALAQMRDITSVVHPSERIGEAAAKLLLSMIYGSPGESILFPPELIARGSVKPLEEAL